MNESLGTYLKRIRKERNLTLRMVEKRTQISNAYLSQLENGKITHPSPKILHKLADCYNVPYERLMELTGYPMPETSRTEAKKLDLAFRLSRAANELTEDDKRKVIEYIEFLKSRKGTKK